MTTLDQPYTHETWPPRQSQATGLEPRDDERRVNVGPVERAASVAAGAILAALGAQRRSLAGAAVAGVGAALLHRGVTGHCYGYSALGIDTSDRAGGATGRDIARRGIHVEQAMLINRPAQEIYDYFRRFENLPSIMGHLDSVEQIDERRSHWVAHPARITGRIEWDAEITRDEPGREIAWRSLPGGDIETAGAIRFEQALGDRGTRVHVTMAYVPPAGRLGHWFATAIGESPEHQFRSDLRNLKRVLELGEVPTTEGQPRGTCLGGGTRE